MDFAANIDEPDWREISEWLRSRGYDDLPDCTLTLNGMVDLVLLIQRLEAMEAGFEAAQRIIHCHETGYLSDTPMDPQIASELHTRDLEKFNAAAALLGDNG